MTKKWDFDFNFAKKKLPLDLTLFTFLKFFLYSSHGKHILFDYKMKFNADYKFLFILKYELILRIFTHEKWIYLLLSNFFFRKNIHAQVCLKN